MAVISDRAFHLYVTHVDGDGPFLRICGQLDRSPALLLENSLQKAKPRLENAIGSVTPLAIKEGIICVTKYKDGNYYRAKVTSTANLSNGLVGVFFIDFGNKDIISLSTIRLLDLYDPLLSNVPGQATEYYLSRIIHPSGKWDEALILKIQSLLCYSEFIANVEGQVQSFPLIAMQFRGTDLSLYLVTNRFGAVVTVAEQNGSKPDENYGNVNVQSNISVNETSYTDMMPFLYNQSYNIPNPASAMRLQQNVPIPGITPAMNQRVIVSRASRSQVNLMAPARQPQQAFPKQQTIENTPPPQISGNKPISPKKKESFKTHLLEVYSEHKVYVSCADDGPESFSVQLMATRSELEEMMDSINRTPLSSLKEPASNGRICLSKMSKDQHIYRALITKLLGSQSTVYLVDYGDTECVSYYDIFEIPQEFLKQPAFAISFCLTGFKSIKNSKNLKEVFKQLVKGKIFTLKVMPAEGPPLLQYCKLYYENKSVFDMLIETLKHKHEFEFMEMLPLGTKYTVLVSYVDSCIKFFVQLTEKIDELNAVMDSVKIHCENSSSPGELPVGSACCARFPDDGNWYRASVKKYDGTKVTVDYVDYGNEQEIEISDLRTITPELLSLPAQAMKCALKGFESKPVETKTSNQLEMLALEKTLTAHITGKLSNDTMLVTLIDETTSPPLDVAKRMNQLSQPRSNLETKPAVSSRKDAPEIFSSSENGSDDGRRKHFKREKSFKEDRRPHNNSNSDDFGQRGGSFRNRDNRDSFERSGPGRHSEKFGGRPDRSDRRGGPKSWESSPPEQTEGSWDEPGATSNFQQSNDKPTRDRDRFNKSDERQERRDDWGGRSERGGRPDRREDRSDRRDNWGDKKENWNQKRDFRDRGERGERGDRNRSNFSPRDRAERHSRSFASDERPDRNSRTFTPRNIFTEVQYKELPNPLPLDTPFAEVSIESEAQHEVAVTWIISPENFYTQILSNQQKFLDMMHGIPEMYKGVRPFQGTVTEGSTVLARYPADGVLYRATVESIQPFFKFIVRYVDFGNKQLVDAKDIWQMDASLMELPKMAIHCSLVGVTPKDGEWKADPEIDLCFNAPRYQCVFHDSVDGQYNVSLWNNGVSVADMLVEKQLAILSDQQLSVTLKDEAIDLNIIVGQQIMCKVTHVESFEKFYVQLDLEKAKLVESAIKNFDANLLTPLEGESVTEGTHCTVRHEGIVHRAILGAKDDTDPTQLAVVLPDLGKTIVTSQDQLMILPTELSVYFYQSLECCLNNYTESTMLMTLEEFKEKLTGNQFIIYINDVDEITLLATLYDPASGRKVEVLEPDEGAYEEVVPLCMRAVFNYNFGMAYVSHVENLNEVYLQKTTDTDRLAALLEQLYQFYEEGSPEPLSNCEVDSLCVAKSSDGNWYRATVISVLENEANVHFTDYGNTETVPKDTLKKLDPKFFEPCALALVVSLGLVALQDEATAKLVEWTSDQEVQVTVAFGTDGWLASLHLDGVDLSTKLVTEKLATPQMVTDEEKLDIPTEVPKSSPEGCTQVYISHIDTPGQFWLQMAEKVDSIEEIQAELQTNGNTYEDVVDREMGTLCVAKYSADDQWYRAEILDSDSDITTVRFIDYGNTDVLDNQPGLLKMLPEHLKSVERFALKSSVNAVPTGTGQWSEPASDYFTQLVGDLTNPLDALIVLNDVTTYVDVFVDGQNLTDRLVAEGHATKSEEECGDLASCFASHVNSPSEFWIQLESAVSELQVMETAMEDAENFPELTEKEEGVICAAKYPEDGAWYRAQVIVDGSEGTEVLFMDYGNASIATELRTLPDDLKQKPALSRKCALQKPRHIKSWSRKSETKFNDLTAEGATVFNVQFVASGDLSIVELYMDGKSVTAELVNLCEEPPSTERPTPVGQDLHVTGTISYVNSVDEFYVQLEDNKSELNKITDALSNAIDFDSVSELKVGSLCAAFWDEDEQWYRAKILEFCDGGYHVQFIDYGNKAKCEEFTKLPEDLASIEPMAKSCQLAGIEESIYQIAKNKLEELAADETSTFQIEFLDSTKQPVLVRLSLNGEDFGCFITTNEGHDAKIVDTNVSSENNEPSLVCENNDKTVTNENEMNINQENRTASCDVDSKKEKNELETAATREMKNIESHNENDLNKSTEEEVSLDSSFMEHNESTDSTHTIIENRMLNYSDPLNSSLEETEFFDASSDSKNLVPSKDKSTVSFDSFTDAVKVESDISSDISGAPGTDDSKGSKVMYPEYSGDETPTKQSVIDDGKTLGKSDAKTNFNDISSDISGTPESDDPKGSKVIDIEDSGNKTPTKQTEIDDGKTLGECDAKTNDDTVDKKVNSTETVNEKV